MSQKYVGDFSWPVACSVDRGLEGAITGETKIGYVDGENGRLVYRGYDIADLAEHSSFEEVCFLLLEGSLPSSDQLQRFSDRLKDRFVPSDVLDLIYKHSTHCHPMGMLRTAVSLLGVCDADSDDVGFDNQRRISLSLMAKLPTLVGAISRARASKSRIDPDPSLSLAGDLLWQVTGIHPTPELVRTMDVCLILHADHGMNASTFASMVVNSSLSDMYSSVVSGIASLKGSLHGGANERSLEQLESFGSPEAVPERFAKMLEKKERVMGFGHRVYKAYDPRAKILGEYAKRACQENGRTDLFETAKALEKEVVQSYGKKGIWPNVDFYSGIIYKAMGIETAMFTPLFAVARVPGWTSRVLEYLPTNRIFRPRAQYTGASLRPYVRLRER